MTKNFLIHFKYIPTPYKAIFRLCDLISYPSNDLVIKHTYTDCFPVPMTRPLHRHYSLFGVIFYIVQLNITIYVSV